MTETRDTAAPPASVGGRAITEGEITARMLAIRSGPLASRLPDAGPEDRRAERWVLRSLVAEEIITQEAGSFDPVSVFAEVTANVVVDEESLRRYYHSNSDLFDVPPRAMIRHFLAATLDDALLVLDTRSGDGGWSSFELRRGEFSGPLENAVFTASRGAVVGPIASELGWHVAVVLEIQDARAIPYEEAKPAIEATLLAEARERHFDLWLEGRRREMATVLPAWGHPGDPTLPDFSHRH